MNMTTKKPFYFDGAKIVWTTKKTQQTETVLYTHITTKNIYIYMKKDKTVIFVPFYLKKRNKRKQEVTSNKRERKNLETHIEAHILLQHSYTHISHIIFLKK